MSKKEQGELFTKITGKLLTGVRDLCEWGIDAGQTTPEKLQLTVWAQTELETKLIEAGMTAHAAAKAMGIPESTLRSRKTRAKRGKSSLKARTTKAEKRAARERELAGKVMALPDKRYGVIVADPEWQFEPWSEETGMDRAADNHYPTSTTDEIAARPVHGIAADDCILFLWATVPMLRDALRVMDAWGFEYKSHAIWDKVYIGTGYWFRNQHELLLIGTKGEILAPAMGDLKPSSVIPVPRKEHSAKPERFLEVIEGYFPTLPKIELNRRGPPRPGWDAWGDEVELPQAAE